MMRLWKVVVLVNFALAVGVGLGYLRWAREVRELRQEVMKARQAAIQLEAAPRSWTVRGVVRVVARATGAVFITHETIPGLMQGMTMGFEAEDPRVLDGIRPGDPVRFTLREKGERVFLTAIQKVEQP
jgi:Cu/Ag efflux protein CusF